MPFKKFVEIGRIAFCADGPEKGKIAAIVNVIDQNRVLLDGPTTGVKRQVILRLSLHTVQWRVAAQEVVPSLL